MSGFTEKWGEGRKRDRDRDTEIEKQRVKKKAMIQRVVKAAGYEPLGAEP